jgi:2,3-bisphosphoglycerate-independent phosphoglycerate mutase
MKTALIILDGRGTGLDPHISAVAVAHTPHFDSLRSEYPHTTLEASGLAVGLPAGQVGNSEVGHMTIGAGRVLYQDLVKINKAISENTLKDTPALIYMLEKHKNLATQGQKSHPVHLFCLLSDAGVHAHIEHLFALIDILDDAGIRFYVHGFLDGRDCDPKSGTTYIQQLERYI